MDLETLEAVAGEPVEDLPQGAELLDAANSKADEVAAIFRPLFALLAGLGPECAAFYTEAKVQEASAVFVMLAESEGWELANLRGKWGMRFAFVMCITPPHAVQWAISRLMKFAIGEDAPDQAEPAEATG